MNATSSSSCKVHFFTDKLIGKASAIGCSNYFAVSYRQSYTCRTQDLVMTNSIRNPYIEAVVIFLGEKKEGEE